MMDKLTDYGVIDSTLIYASSEMGNPAPAPPHAQRTDGPGWQHQRQAPHGTPPQGAGRLPFIQLWPASRAMPRSTGPPTTICSFSIAQATLGVASTAFGTQPNAADKNGPLAGLT